MPLPVRPPLPCRLGSAMCASRVTPTCQSPFRISPTHDASPTNQPHQYSVSTPAKIKTHNMSTHIRPPSPTATTTLLLAAADHNVPVLTSILAKMPSGINHCLDPDTQRSALHVAIDSLSPSDPPEKHAAAEETLRQLLFHGAIWNDLDSNDETPGCIAYRKGLSGCYEVMVEAGLRAEVLLARLGGWEELSGGEDDEDDDEEEAPDAVDTAAAPEPQKEEVPTLEPKPATEADDVNAASYLASELRYDDTKLVDSDNNGVMMSWERGIMERSVEELLPNGGAGKRVLNVGFGMGIIDSYIQTKSPARHVIVEPHPDVLARMRTDGWFDKPGVTVLEGRWQDALPQLLANGDEMFDAIYFDTFAEPYSALKTFFNELVITLLEPRGGRFGFFHGLGADRRISYDVYTRVLEMDLFEAGLEVAWKDVKIETEPHEKNPDGSDRWKGTRRKYWDVGDVYKLPVCEFLSGMMEG
ncbi:S-adenosyl-L-methionine-dependent methyltransferase [Geopyxis carbonaria]|nr:S-adenosyl-L-methionine-dependent methyltransferase [Geopyxis carbonaria]